MKRDSPLWLEERLPVGTALLLNYEDLANGGLLEVVPDDVDVGWALYCKVSKAGYDLFEARKARPESSAHVLVGKFGVSYLVVVCESDGFQQRVVVPLLGPEAAQFAHLVRVRKQLTLLLGDETGRASLAHWGLTGPAVEDWSAAVMAEPSAPQDVLNEVIRLVLALEEPTALDSIDRHNSIRLVSVATYLPPQLDEALPVPAREDRAGAPVH